MITKRVLITIVCGAAIAGLACNQRVAVLDKAVDTPVSPTPAAISRPPNVDRVVTSANAVTLRFSAPAGMPLRRGVYEGATHAPLNTTTPGIAVGGRARGCTESGRFEIHDIDLQNNHVNRLHVSFEQRCANFSGLLTGELRLRDAPQPSIYPQQSCLQ